MLIVSSLAKRPTIAEARVRCEALPTRKPHSPHEVEACQLWLVKNFPRFAVAVVYPKVGLLSLRCNQMTDNAATVLNGRSRVDRDRGSHGARWQPMASKLR